VHFRQWNEFLPGGVRRAVCGAERRGAFLFVECLDAALTGRLPLRPRMSGGRGVADIRAQARGSAHLPRDVRLWHLADMTVFARECLLSGRSERARQKTPANHPLAEINRADV